MSQLRILLDFYTSPVFLGVMLSILCIALLGVYVVQSKKTYLYTAMDMFFESIYNFYSDILGNSASKHITVYIVSLFFILFIVNILSVILDFFAPVFGFNDSGEFFLANYIVFPTSVIEFPLAISIFSVLLILFMQIRSVGLGKFIYNFLPIFGKSYLVLEKAPSSKILYYPIIFFIKIADICISFFLGVLDMIGQAARIISLSFRLFGNMISGTILVGMLIVGVSNFSQSFTGFVGGIDLPIILPIIVYAQGLLVGSIQALVFPLLVAIFIRIASIEDTKLG